MPSVEPTAIIANARERALTIAIAESLTGGRVCATLVEGEGSSEVVAGAVVAYQLESKSRVLGVPSSLLEDPGPVSREVAVAMARGVRELLGTSVGMSTTGAAGPESHGGAPAGTVFISVISDAGEDTREFAFTGDRAQVTGQAHAAALAMLDAMVSRVARVVRSGGEQD